MVSFVNESTIHGVSYIFGPNRSVPVRIFWACLFISSISSAFYLIRVAHAKWMMEPFIVLTKYTTRPIEEFPQFAVTVCPGIISDNESLTHHAMREKIKKEDKGSNKIFTDEECFQIQLNSLWCGDFRDLSDFWKKISSNSQSKLCSPGYPPYEHNAVISTLFRNYEGSFQKIMYGDVSLLNALKKNDKNFMSHAVKPKITLTSSGVCSTFNMYSKTIYKDVDETYGLTNKEDPDIEWSPDSGYFTSYAKHPKKMKIDELPGTKRKISGVILLKDLLNKNACYYSGGNIKVIIHQPNEVPTVQHKSIDVKHGTNVALKIKIKNKRSLESYRKISSDIRQCYFEDEKKVEPFRNYSKYHCEVGCISYEILKTCHMLEIARPKNCTESYYCANHKVGVDYDPTSNAFYDPNQCFKRCWKNCNNMNFKIANAAPMNPNEILSDEILKIHKISNIIVIEHESEEIEETEKSTSYTLPGFLSELGGYLGLFLGCSFLSFIEIAFFAVTKLINVVRKVTQKQPQKSKNLRDVIDEIKTAKAKILVLREEHMWIKEMTQRKSEEKNSLIDGQKMIEEDTEKVC